MCTDGNILVILINVQNGSLIHLYECHMIHQYRSSTFDSPIP